MSNLTKSLITGVSVFGAGLIGYEILGDTVFGKAPTLLKWIRGKNISKTPEHINYKNSISKMDIPYRREDVPYRGHRHFPLDFNKNPNGIGLSEKQKKIEKVLNIIENVLNIFNDDEEVGTKKFEKKIGKLNLKLDKLPSFDKVKEIYDFIFENYEERYKQKTTDEKLNSMIKELLSWIPQDYFDQDVTSNKLKFVQFKMNDKYYLSLYCDDMRIAFDIG